MPRLPLSAALLALLGATSCAEGGADFHARYEPGFTEGPKTISVLGVFHEGRLNPESWAQIGPPLSTLLGKHACEVGYGPALGGEHPELYTAVDESVRSEGVTEELLTRLSPAAQGDFILVVSLNGHVTVSQGVDDGSRQGAGAVPQPGRGSRTRSGRPPGGGARGRGAEWNELTLLGTLYSVLDHRSVARLQMVYSGSNLDEAIGLFVARTGKMVPGSSCLGWRWEKIPSP